MLNNTILIGTCRIKRMLAFVDDKKIKERIKQVSTHTHYVAEIHQLISYLQGKDIPNELLGLVIDDINVGKLNSYQEIEKWREETKNYLKQADKVIIEVSSLKKFILSNEPLYFGNITAIGSVIGGKDRLADFIQKEMLRKKFSSLKPALSEEEEIIVLMKKIKRLLPNKKILWMSHFRYFIESREEEIAERKKLNSWIQKGAKLLGDDYFDQTIIVDELGANSALKDSSHYSEEAEKLMAKVISLWIKKDKIYASSSEGSYFSLLNKEINKKEKKDKIVKQIKKYTKDKNHKKVIELYTLLIEQEPNNIKYYYSIIGQALLLNDFDTAMNYLSIFEKIGSNEALFHISKGRVHYKKREYDEARKAFINLLDNERYAEMAYETIASTYLTEKNTDQLANFIDNYQIEFIPRYKIFFIRGKLEFIQRNFIKAREFFEESLNLNHEYEHSYIWIVKANLRLERYSDSIESLKIAYDNIVTSKLIKQLDKLTYDIEILNDRVLLVGTCRIKRPRAFIKNDVTKKRIALVSSHVHYASEIYQMLAYLQGNNIPENLLGVIIDDINVGKLKSYEEVNLWREKTYNLLKNSKKIIIEISSLKKFILQVEAKYYGNITALENMHGKDRKIPNFINKEELVRKFIDLNPKKSQKDEIIKLMKKIKSLLPNKKILWLSHFRYYIKDINSEIEERKKLNLWVKEGAEQIGDDYFDQTQIIDTLGVDKALIDSSHYSKEAEELIANILSQWIENGKITLEDNMDS